MLRQGCVFSEMMLSMFYGLTGTHTVCDGTHLPFTHCPATVTHWPEGMCNYRLCCIRTVEYMWDHCRQLPW